MRVGPIRNENVIIRTCPEMWFVHLLEGVGKEMRAKLSLTCSGWEKTKLSPLSLPVYSYIHPATHSNTQTHIHTLRYTLFHTRYLLAKHLSFTDSSPSVSKWTHVWHFDLKISIFVCFLFGQHQVRLCFSKLLCTQQINSLGFSFRTCYY